MLSTATARIDWIRPAAQSADVNWTAEFAFRGPAVWHSLPHFVCWIIR